MFVVVYKFRVRQGEEEKFRAAWADLTRAIHAFRGSQGARLHQVLDDPSQFVAYVQWPDREAYEAAGGLPPADAGASESLVECLIGIEPPTFLQVTEDLLERPD